MSKTDCSLPLLGHGKDEEVLMIVRMSQNQKEDELCGKAQIKMDLKRMNIYCIDLTIFISHLNAYCCVLFILFEDVI